MSILFNTDDLNLAYHSVLPLEVHGANYCAMKLLTKQCLAPQMVRSLTYTVTFYVKPHFTFSGYVNIHYCVCVCWQPCVVVKQLTLDIEHYLGETVRTTAEWGHRYLSFTDYDVQIVEVHLV